MKELEFPIIGTKVEGLEREFNLSDPKERALYFEAKAGGEIHDIREYLDSNRTFVAFLIGKKNSGKGTYSKMLAEVLGEDKFTHISVGDLVREYHQNWASFSGGPQFNQLKRIYRGYQSFEEAQDAFIGRSTERLLPTEFVLALLKLHISEHRGKSIFLDGLPRETDQVSYSLYFRDLIGYRDDPDTFVLIDVPENVISERIKYRVICPICNTSRNKKLLVTGKVDYDEKAGEFHLICDNTDCKGARMVPKEGDELGIEPIRPRLIKDEEILKAVFAIYGVSKILLRNHVPVEVAQDHFDNYELTPGYVLTWNPVEKRVVVKEKPWVFKDDNGVDCYSLLPQPVVISLIKQLAEMLRF